MASTVTIDLKQSKWVGCIQRQIRLRVKAIPEIIKWLDFELNMIQERFLPMADLWRFIDEILRTEVNFDGE